MEFFPQNYEIILSFIVLCLAVNVGGSRSTNPLKVNTSCLTFWALAKLQSNLESKRFSYSTCRCKYCTEQTCIKCRLRFIFLFCMRPGVTTHIEVPAEFLCWPLLPSCDREAAAAAATLSNSQHLLSFYFHQKLHDCWPTCSCHLVAVGRKFEDSLMVQCGLFSFWCHLFQKLMFYFITSTICYMDSCNLSREISLRQCFLYITGIML